MDDQLLSTRRVPAFGAGARLSTGVDSRGESFWPDLSHIDWPMSNGQDRSHWLGPKPAARSYRKQPKWAMTPNP